MFKPTVEKENMYWNGMESFLFYNGKPLNRNTEEIEWLNVQNAEQTFQRQKRVGKWLVVQIKLENACNWKSDSTNVQNAAMYSAKC